MERVNVFVDESGSIIKGPLQNADFFVVALIFTDNEKFLNKVFKKKRLKILTEKELDLLRATREIKGSDINDKRKESIYSALVEKCGENLEIVVSNKASRPLYEQISSQIKAAIMSGELKAGEAIPSVRSLAKSLHISILTVQKAYATLQEDGFIETTAGKGCYVSAQNQDFYLEEQQKKIEEKFAEAIEIARTSGISLNKLTDLLTLMYQEDDGE